jgi:hypothetical protein
LTPTVTLSKNGGSFAAAAGGVSEVGNGLYALAGNATDRNALGTLVLHAEAAGADDADVSCEIITADPFGDSVLGLNIDSTGGTLSLAKALEALVARELGNLAYDADTGVLTFYGRDGVTAIGTVKLTGQGNRSESTIA